MKKGIAVILVIFSLLVPDCVIGAQEEVKNEPATKLEAIFLKKGKLLVKDFYSLGQVQGGYNAATEFDAVVIHEPNQQQTEKIKGIRVQITQYGSYEKSDTSFLDMDELASLSRALSYIQELAGRWGQEERQYSESIFSTKGDFSIGFYQQKKEQKGFASSGYIGKVSCYFGVSELAKIKEIVDNGIKLLSEK